MKKSIISTTTLLMPLVFFSQVGINTDNPEATIDINGNAKIRTIDEITNLSNHKVLLVDETTDEIVKVDKSILGNTNSSGNVVVSNITKATANGSSILLDTNFYSGWDRINHTPDADFSANYNITNSTYKVPEDGVYAINFQYRFGNGVQLQLLSFNGTPRIGILKHNTDGTPGYVELDEKEFEGVSVNLAVLSALSILISNTEIDSFYRLKKDDVLSFEFFKGGIALDLLGDSNTSLQIYKISD